MSDKKKNDEKHLPEMQQNVLLEQEKLRQEEGLIAISEAKKRLQKQNEHGAKTEETEKYEMERAEREMKQRNETMQLVKDHEIDYEKQLMETYQAKTKDEAVKVKQWEKERLLEDLEMEEKIKMRHELLKQKQLDFKKAREEAEAEARNIEASNLASSKAFKEKNIQDIAIETFYEEEQRKKEERIKQIELMKQKKDEIERKRLEMEEGALVKEKEKRAQTLELQKAEFNRYENEIAEGKDVRDVDEIVKLHGDSLEQEEHLKRATEKERIEREKQLRVQETERHEAELQKLVETQKKTRQTPDNCEYDENDEERLRLEALKRRQQQQQEIMSQQEQELEMLMKTKVKLTSNDADHNEKAASEKKKGFFSSLFGKR